jgi:peroxiredoxin
MLVYIHPKAAVWLSAEELDFVRMLKKQERMPATELTFNQLAVVNKLQAKAIIRRKKHDEVVYLQIRHSIQHLPF